MAKRFRKVYIVCEDNKVFTNVSQVPMYNNREQADRACELAYKRAVEEQKQAWRSNHPLPKFKVHGFYLVHEDMFRS